MHLPDHQLTAKQLKKREANRRANTRLAQQYHEARRQGREELQRLGREGFPHPYEPRHGFTQRYDVPEPEGFHRLPPPEQDVWMWENTPFEIRPVGWSMLRQELGLARSPDPLTREQLMPLYAAVLQRGASREASGDWQSEMDFLIEIAWYVITGERPPFFG